jgi:hypothetical protein
MVTQVGYSVAGQSRGRVAPCAICTVHVEMRSVCFLVQPKDVNGYPIHKTRRLKTLLGAGFGSYFIPMGM